MTVNIPIEIVDIDGGCHIFAEARLKDRTLVNLIIDTGASKSVLDEALALKYTSPIENENELHPAGINSEIGESRPAILDEINFDALCIKNTSIVLIDLSYINIIYADVSKKKINGLLGGDILRKYKAIIDYENQTLSLNS